MSELKQDLEFLYDLDEARERARTLREAGLQTLKKIKKITLFPNGVKVEVEEKDKPIKDFNKFIVHESLYEIASLVQIQNHRAIGKEADENDTAEADDSLIDYLLETDLQKLLPSISKPECNKVADYLEINVPVLCAARTMSALAMRSRTVFKPATMFCYYRILREFNIAGQNGWAIGAARAGNGGAKSAFVTTECVRAIFAFENAVKKTIQYLEQIEKLNRRYQNLVKVVDSVKTGDEDFDKLHPIYKWAQRVAERILLDSYLSTNPRSRQIVFFARIKDENLQFEGKALNENQKQKLAKKNQLLISDYSAKDENNNIKLSGDEPVDHFSSSEKENILEKIGKYLEDLPDNLMSAFSEAQTDIGEALKQIIYFRVGENPFQNTQVINDKFEFDFNENYKAKINNEHLTSEQKSEDVNHYQITQTAHLTAYREVLYIYKNFGVLIKKVEENRAKSGKPKSEELKIIIKELISFTKKFPRQIRKTMASTKQFVASVIDHEIREYNAPFSNSFDAGELVFAAVSFGWMTEWQSSEVLKKVCEIVGEILPENGRLQTHRPYHASPQGYKLYPIGCEITRALAQLFHKTNFEFSPSHISRMLNIFEERLVELENPKDEKKLVAWNFSGSPRPDCGNVWVTAVSVSALDRIVKMLNNRINETVFKHFEVIRPVDKANDGLTLGKLIYTDYGFAEYLYNDTRIEGYAKNLSIPIYLEAMKAHLTRAKLPDRYSKQVIAKSEPNDQAIQTKCFSTILYGPPGVGKTTLAQALAKSSDVPILLLSPGELMVEGQEMMEAKARQVFDAISMLTQAVIVFDEFEPVLQNRSKTDGEESDASDNGCTSTELSLKKIASQLKGISDKDDPKFQFLFGGMLPKLIKLNAAAANQSLVYFLGTNYLNKIDEAARRPGRFDLKIPVYNPCPLSRAGALLYRLCQVQDNKIELDNKNTLKRFIQVVLNTSNKPASDFAKIFFKIRLHDDGRYTTTSDWMNYVLDENKSVPTESVSNKDIGELLKNPNNLDELEKIELNNLYKYEKGYKYKNQTTVKELTNQLEAKTDIDGFRQFLKNYLSIEEILDSKNELF